MDLSLAVLSGFAVALLAPFLPLKARASWGRALALVPAALFAFFLTRIPTIRDGGEVRRTVEWVPSLDVAFSFRLDGLALVMALLITGMGTLVVLYAAGYFAGKPRVRPFYLAIFAFMGAMLGLVLADNVITLFVFWELTSITSFLLIAFEHERAEARKAATQALIVTGAGGLALLAGLILMAEVAGSYELSAILASGDAVRDAGAYAGILVLVLLGAFTKSAQFPFHFWLPGAMAAPTPVSAYLHSATMVKAGVYLLARLHPALGDTDGWLYAVGGIGGVTMVLGAYVAVHEHDLKRILAYSTVSALGLLTALLGLGTPLALKAAVVFLIAHALYKGALFLVAGSIDHETKTRDIRALGGLRRAMPYSTVGAVVAASALAGLAPFLAFIGKEAALDALADERELVPAALLAGLVVTGALYTVAAAMALRPFFGAARGPKVHHDAGPLMTAGPLVLGALSLAFGLAPGLIDGPLVKPAVQSIAPGASTPSLALWHGPNLPLALSLLSVGAGALIAWQREALRPLSARLVGAAGEFRPTRAYEHGLEGLISFARLQTRVLQNGYLRIYLSVVLVATVVLAALPLVLEGGLTVDATEDRITVYEAAIVAVVLVGALTAVVSDTRLGAVAALGAVGFGVAIIYAFFSAPDLAMTQFLVETLTVLLFVLVFYRLPRLVDRSKMTDRLRDAAIAIAFGGLMTVLVLAATTHQFAPSISEEFARRSVPEGFGHNVVNVILVDFRALDTLGEIVVLSVAAFGVLALLRVRRGRYR